MSDILRRVLCRKDKERSLSDTEDGVFNPESNQYWIDVCNEKEQKIAELREENICLAHEKERMRDKQEQEIRKLKDKMIDIRIAHEKEIKELKYDYEKEIAEMRRNIIAMSREIQDYTLLNDSLLRVRIEKANAERGITPKKSHDGYIVLAGRGDDDGYTGTKIQGRRELDKILRQVKPNDTIVFDEVSRMSRDAAEGFQLYQELFSKGIELVFLKEPHINTSTYKESLNGGLSPVGNDIADIYIEATNRVLMLLAEKQIRFAFDQAQKEVDYLHTRTKEGMAKAKEAGRIAGRREGAKIETKKAKEAKQIILKHNKSFGGSLTNDETWKLAGISKMSFYKYRKELIMDNNAICPYCIKA